MTDVLLKPDATLGELAATRPGASKIFFRHQLDFCCTGDRTLAEACARDGLDAARIAEEIQRADAEEGAGFERWDQRPLSDVVEHILEAFHADHREELPRLIEMARKVEEVHAESPDRPDGLSDHLLGMAQAMELHMRKEEQVLFPMIQQGHGAMAGGPVHVMEEEHRDHGENLARLRALAHDFEPPEDACNTWRALYLGLEKLEQDLMRHIHLENHVLFPRALSGD